MDRTYKFRLYPSKKQDLAMRKHLQIAKNLWNELLTYSKTAYENMGKFPTKSMLQKKVKRKGLYSQTAQEIAHRLHKAITRVFKLKRLGKKAGFPRFKSIDRMKSICYPQFGFKLDKKLLVSSFGEIAIVRHREIKGKVKSLILKRESSGKWHAFFIVENKLPSKQKSGNKVGIDVGLTTFATLSDGTKIQNPRHIKKYEDRLKWLQRQLSRKQKGSKNREKAKLRLASTFEKLANTRSDFLHKLSYKLVNSYSLIALERLSVQKMMKYRLSKYINDAAFCMFTNMLAYKAEEAGCRVIFVNPENTTKMCSRCGNLKDMNLSDRLYACENCGFIIDRDHNSAKNILIKAVGQELSESTPVDILNRDWLKREAL